MILSILYKVVHVDVSRSWGPILGPFSWTCSRLTGVFFEMDCILHESTTDQNMRCFLVQSGSTHPSVLLKRRRCCWHLWRPSCGAGRMAFQKMHPLVALCPSDISLWTASKAIKWESRLILKTVTPQSLPNLWNASNRIFQEVPARTRDRKINLPIKLCMEIANGFCRLFGLKVFWGTSAGSRNF